MRMLLIVLATAAFASPASAACFEQCFNEQVPPNADDIAVKDTAVACRKTCEAEVVESLTKAGVYDKVKACRGEPLTLEEFREVRGASPSYRVQSNVFLWDVKNPFADRVITKIEVSTQNMDLQELSFVGAGLIAPSSSGTFVIPSFYEGYPAVRFSGKVKTIWACAIK